MHSILISKATKRKVADFWKHRCAICGNNDFLEFHHIIQVAAGGTDDYDNLILLCACCHAKVHNRTFNPEKPNCKTSIDYEIAKPILDLYFSNQIGTKEKQLTLLSNLYQPCGKALFRAAAALSLHSLEQSS